MWHSPKLLICFAHEEGQKGRIIMSNNTQNNNAVVNNNVKEESTMSKIFNVNNAKVAAATPFTLAGAGAAFVAEVCRASAEKIAGDQVSRAPGYGYLAAHTTGSISSKKMAAMAEALKAEAKKEASEEKHSKYATWDKWHWVASEAAKEKGWGIPSLYKAANRLIDCSRKGADFVPSYKDGDDKPHTLAVWVYRGLYDHITNVLKKDVDDDRLKTAFEQAVKLSKASIDKLPKVEDIIAFAQAEAKLVNNAKVEQPVEVVAEERITVEEGREILAEVEAEEQEEARDGRAPKTEAKAKFNINQLVHKAGVPRLKADNAYQVAEKAKAAFKAKKLTNDEFQFVVEACIAKDGGDPEEFYALMGEN